MFDQCLINATKGLAEVGQNKGRRRFAALRMLIQGMHRVDEAVCSREAVSITKLLWIDVEFEVMCGPSCNETFEDFVGVVCQSDWSQLIDCRWRLFGDWEVWGFPKCEGKAIRVCSKCTLYM